MGLALESASLSPCVCSPRRVPLLYILPSCPCPQRTWLLVPASGSWMAGSPPSEAWKGGLAPGGHAECSCASCSCCPWEGGLTASAAPLQGPGSPPCRKGLGRHMPSPPGLCLDTHLPALGNTHPGSPGGTHSGWGPRPPPLWGLRECEGPLTDPSDPHLVSRAGPGWAQDKGIRRGQIRAKSWIRTADPVPSFHSPKGDSGVPLTDDAHEDVGPSLLQQGTAHAGSRGSPLLQALVQAHQVPVLSQEGNGHWG